jgi:hypothetical protein
VAVTRAASLPRAEVLRLVDRLSRANIAVPVVLVNAVGAGTCARCSRDGRRQRREIEALRTALRSRRRPCALVVAPAQVPPPHGMIALAAWRDAWRQPLLRRRAVK